MLQLAWQNVTHKKIRAIASIGGVAFSILLMFMQLGIFSAAERSAEIVFQALDFDIALTSPQYLFLASSGDIPRSAMDRAIDVGGIEEAFPLHAAYSLYRNTDDKLRRGMLLFGIDPGRNPFVLPEIVEQVGLLTMPDTALVDREARGEYGPRDVGVESELGIGRVEFVGQYTLGTGFIAGADAIVGDDTFCRLVPGTSVDRPNLGLIKLFDPSAVDRVIGRLRRSLGKDVVVHSRDELERLERNYFVNVKPIGIMFQAGVIVGFLVGAVTLYQILASQVNNHIRELATLKAMGYTDDAVNGVVMLEGVIYAIIGYVPAFFGGLALYAILRQGANVPVDMTIPRAVFVFALTLVMCAVSGMLAVRRVRRADPAELFG